MELTKSKIQLGSTIIRNRTVSSPLGINMAHKDGSVSENIISYFSNLANDLGMVCVGAVAVSDEGVIQKIQCILKAIFSNGLKELSKAIKSHGAAAYNAIISCYAQGNTNYSGKRVVGPSKYIVPDIGIVSKY